MDSTVVDFLIIVVPVLIVAAIIVYFLARRRANRYIIYADWTEYRTDDGKTFQISELKRIHYMDKYIMGKGIETANYGLAFYFADGMVEIDRNSNIYQAVFDHAAKLQVPKTNAITKGLLRMQD